MFSRAAYVFTALLIPLLGCPEPTPYYYTVTQDAGAECICSTSAQESPPERYYCPESGEGSGSSGGTNDPHDKGDLLDPENLPGSEGRVKPDPPPPMETR